MQWVIPHIVIDWFLIFITQLSLPECPVEDCDVCITDMTKCDECSGERKFDDSTSRCIVGDGGSDDGGGGLSVGAIIG